MTPLQKELIALASQPGASVLRIYLGANYSNATQWRVMQANGSWRNFNYRTGDTLLDKGLLRVKNGLGDKRGPVSGSFVYELTPK